MTALPPDVGRHFAREAVDLTDARDRARVVERLLEDGDRRDLEWMRSVIPAREVALWFDRHAARRLSRRSRALWAAALGRPCPPTPALAAALWPLA
jgi:hypothetical protein